MTEKLIQLQNEIYKYETTDFETGEEREYFIGYAPKIEFSKIGEFYSLSFYGNGFDDDPTVAVSEFDYETNFAFCRFLEFISEQQHAEKIISLHFGGQDEGANGTKSWVFDRIINSDAVFSNLKVFAIQQTDLGDHNQSIIDSDFSMEENGTIAKLVIKMPKLESLVIPSAPDKSFFEIGKHPLSFLKVQAGYNHQNFIKNLSESENFHQLSALDYSEVIDVFDMPVEDYTNFEDFKKLFLSKAFSFIKHFKLRNSILTEEQLFELQKLNDVQFLNIRSHGGRYVSHLMNENNK
ncbi:hypothetical protein [Epilithonimonas xixisoli]|uniref:Uncharacterized protein n=1 Tax=Epilithonimonas xixisoli TaxID=1476462 RepID=A0A4R8IKU3_9FLAO|nr:hypothetical protein [Epilithonimonas xixisoli]TDX87299.1 hypothetical protein B0I22_1487 [Epilithonimonas xixisoli]